MTTSDFTPGALVIVNGRLGRIVREARLGAATGYSVTTTLEARDGYAPHFAADHNVQPARVGVNVCRHPHGEHWCGLVHVTARDLEDIRRATPAETVNTGGRL